jgi:hypothetical protein
MPLCCVECFKDEFVRQFIARSGKAGECAFCGSSGLACATTEAAGRFVLEGLLRAYEGIDQVPGSWDSEDKCYTLDGQTAHEILGEMELLSDRVYEEDQDAQLVTALVRDGSPSWHDVAEGTDDPLNGGEALLVTKDIFYGPDHNRFALSWRAFKRYVKHYARFFVLAPDTQLSRDVLLRPIGELLGTLKATLRKGERFWRARIIRGSSACSVQDASAWGPAPLKKGGNSRMSPAGISYLYLGSSPELCVAEVRPCVGDVVGIWELEVTQQLRIVDFVSRPPRSCRQSIFDPNYDHDKLWTNDFLRDLVRDLACPLRLEEQPIDYIPTQVLAEFLRSLGFLGMKYPSSQSDNGFNLVCFVGPKEEESMEEIDCGGYPHLLQYDAFFRLVSGSSRRIEAVRYKVGD